MHGDLGPSYRQRGLDVQDILFEPPEGKPFWDSKFGYSLRLGLLAAAMAALFGIPLGILRRPETQHDSLTIFRCSCRRSASRSPTSSLAIFFIIIFASKLKLVKIVQQNWNSPGAWLVPAAILGFGTFASSPG